MLHIPIRRSSVLQGPNVTPKKVRKTGWDCAPGTAWYFEAVEIHNERESPVVYASMPDGVPPTAEAMLALLKISIQMLYVKGVLPKAIFTQEH